MATGNYGTIRPADVAVEDVEIFYSYTPTRESLVNVDLILVATTKTRPVSART